MIWQKVKKADVRARSLADRHYSRQKPGTPQFMPPGQTLVLLSEDGKALFGWHRPHPRSGQKFYNGLDGWNCSIFRNESSLRSSDLILMAEIELQSLYDIGPDGMFTYVFDKKVKSANPGYCFKCAGWKPLGRSKDGLKTLLQKKILRIENYF